VTAGLARLISDLDLSPQAWLAVIAPICLIVIVIALDKRR